MDLHYVTSPTNSGRLHREFLDGTTEGVAEDQIIHGDFQEIINILEPHWADLIVSGPSVHGNGDERWGRELSWVESWKVALKECGILAIVGPMHFMWTIGRAMQQVKCAIHYVTRVTVKNSLANFSSQAVIIATSDNRADAVGPVNLEFEILTKPNHSNGFHLELGQRLVETYSKPGDIVLDPFCGYGTVPISCIQTGRSWIGCEITQDTIDQAYDRIESLTDYRRKA